MVLENFGVYARTVVAIQALGQPHNVVVVIIGVDPSAHQTDHDNRALGGSGKGWIAIRVCRAGKAAAGKRKEKENRRSPRVAHRLRASYHKSQYCNPVAVRAKAHRRALGGPLATLVSARPHSRSSREARRDFAGSCAADRT